MMNFPRHITIAILTMVGAFLIYGAYASQTVITRTAIVGGNVICSGSNGPANGIYKVLATTDAALAVTNWAILNTNNFDASGNFNFTNALTNVQRFYRVMEVSNAVPDFSMIGFATVTNGLLTGTIGGSNGPLVLVSNVTQLVNYATKSNQALRILIITNFLDLGPLNNNDNPTNILQTGKIVIKSDKTIYSTNGATISRGSFHVINTHNVVIRNLKFRDLYFDNSGADPGYDNHDWDYVRVDGGNHVWVDHCDFNQSYDGMIDIKNAGDFVTVSWCIFSNQKKCSLVGSDPSSTSDITHLNVTYHHNWYSNVIDRTPRMRYGNAHVFNLYSQKLTGKAVQSTCQASVLMENSYFQSTSGGHPDVSNNGDSPPSGYSADGAVKVVNGVINPAGSATFVQNQNTNYFLHLSSFSFNPPFSSPTPPYVYTNVLDDVTNVPYIVTNWAGVNKVSL